MNFPTLIDTLHQFASKMSPVVWSARKIRNQCNAVLKYQLGGLHHPSLNGESKLIASMAPRIEFFVDVGANVGDWTAELLQACSAEPRGLLFEPGIDAFQRLKTRFESNRGIKLVNMAVNDFSGNVEFYEEPGAGETSSMSERANLRSSVKRLVDCCRLEDFLDASGERKVDFLKVDVEGFDLHVLRGTGEWLQPDRVRAIQFEYNSSWAFAGSTLFAAKQLLENRGYMMFRLDRRGLHLHNYEQDREFFSYANFFAVAPEAVQHLQQVMAP